MLILLTIHYPCCYFSSPGSFLVLLSPDPRHGRRGEQAFRLRQGQGGQAVGKVFFWASDPTIKDTLSFIMMSWCLLWKFMEIEDKIWWNGHFGGFRPDFQETFPLRQVPSPPQACVFCMQAGDGNGCPVKGGHNDISVGIGLSQSYCGGGNRTWVQGGAPGKLQFL